MPFGFIKGYPSNSTDYTLTMGGHPKGRVYAVNLDVVDYNEAHVVAAETVLPDKVINC